MKTRYEFPTGTRYSLKRESDGAGDAGSMLNAISYLSDAINYDQNVLEIGKACQIGSGYARSYQYQDWWCTTAITGFIEVDEEMGFYRFKTGNSIYELRINQ